MANLQVTDIVRIKTCEGCNLYEICCKDNRIPKFDNTQCPCSKCLIKMMCASACDEYRHFRLSVKRPIYKGKSR
jgi:hypothetical protein